MVKTAAETKTEAPAPAAAATVYSECLAAIRQHKPNFRAQKPTEEDKAYIEHFLHGIADVPDEIYNTLSPAAQNWFAAAADAANDGKVPEPPPGFVSGLKPKEEKPPARKKLITRDKPPAKPPRETTPTMGKLIRMAIIDKKDITVAELEAMLAQNGFTDIKRSTVFSFQRGSLDTLKVAEEMGRFEWPEAATAAEPVEQPGEAA